MTQIFLVPTAAATNPPSALFSLHARPQADVLIPDELPDDVDPALVHRQIIIKLMRDLVELRKARPRHGREVVVLVVESDIVCEEVEDAVVGVCLRDWDLVRWVRGVLGRLLKDVMLGDEVACTGMERASQEAAQDQVSDRFSADKLDECIVEEELGDDVEEVDLRQRELVYEHWAEGVEEDLEGAEEGFAADRVEEKGFEGGGEVGIEAVHAERLVVRKMVWLHFVSFMNNDVCRQALRTLNDALYGIPMGRLANTAKILFASGLLKARLCEISWIARKRFWFAVAPITYAVRNVGHDRNGWSRRRYAQRTCRETTNATTYLVRGSGPQSFVTCECLANVMLNQRRITYLRMGLDNGLSTCPMRLLGVCPEKVVVFTLRGGLLCFLRLAPDGQAPLGRLLERLGGCSDRRLHCASKKNVVGLEEESVGKRVL